MKFSSMYILLVSILSIYIPLSHANITPSQISGIFPDSHLFELGSYGKKKKKAETEEDNKPSKNDCDTAKKLLKEYDRLSQKLGKKIPEKNLESLNTKRDTGIITSNDLPASIRTKFPGSLSGFTLNEIQTMCK